MTFKILTKTNEFLNLEKQWKELEAEPHNKNQSVTFDWLKIWWETFHNRNDNKFGHNKQLFIVLLLKDERIDAIAPLVSLSRFYYGVEINFLEILGQQWAATYSGFITRYPLKKDEKKELFEVIKKYNKSDVIFFNHLLTENDLPVNAQLFPYSACPFIDLSGFSNIDFFKKTAYSKNLKSNFKKAFSWAKKRNQVLESFSTRVNDQNFQTITKLAKSKEISKKEFKYKDPDKKKFREKVYQDLEGQVDFVNINNTEAAYLISICYNGTKIGTDASFDRKYENKYMLGSFAVEQSISMAIQDGLKVFDFGTGIDNYKFKFTNKAILLNYFIEKGGSKFSSLVFLVIKCFVKRKSEKFISELKSVKDIQVW